MMAQGAVVAGRSSWWLEKKQPAPQTVLALIYVATYIMGMKTASKTISGAAYVGIQADLASREGAVSAKLANLFFQCACVAGERTLEEWDGLVVKAMEAEVSVQEALEYGEDD